MSDVERATRTVETRFGNLGVVAGPEGIREITWDPERDRASDRRGGGRAAGAPPAERTADEAARQLAEYARGERRSFDLPLVLPEGPAFRRRVLEELSRVPAYGETISYGRLAELCGRPRAARAVGNAVGSNPLPVVLPCHRVVRSDGSSGQYGGGRERKRELLRLEGALQGPPSAAVAAFRERSVRSQATPATTRSPPAS